MPALSESGLVGPVEPEPPAEAVHWPPGGLVPLQSVVPGERFAVGGLFCVG